MGFPTILVKYIDVSTDNNSLEIAPTFTTWSLSVCVQSIFSDLVPAFQVWTVGIETKFEIKI